MLKTKVGNLFSPQDLVFDSDGNRAHNFAKGFFTDGQEAVEEVLDVIRKQSEDCDCLQGFQFIHDLGGGTGSGFGGLLLSKTKDEYPKTVNSTCSIFPTLKLSSNMLEPYNFILGANQLVEFADQTFVIDLSSINKSAKTMLNIEEPVFRDLNKIIASLMSDSTAGLRYPSKLNSSLKRMVSNLVPFKKLHFYVTSSCSLSQENNDDSKLFKSSNLSSTINPEGKYLAATRMFRGDVPLDVLEKEESEIKEVTGGFVEWIPHNIKSGISSSTTREGQELTGNIIGNNTGIDLLFQKHVGRFSQMFARKTFIRSYLQEGMDIMEFQNADENIRDLVSQK